MNEIINAKRGIAAASTLVLADALQMEPECWLNLQQDWGLWHALQEHKKVKIVLKFRHINKINPRLNDVNLRTV